MAAETPFISHKRMNPIHESFKKKLRLIARLGKSHAGTLGIISVQERYRMAPNKGMSQKIQRGEMGKSIKNADA